MASPYLEPHEIAEDRPRLTPLERDMLAALKAAFPIVTRLAEQQRQERGGKMEGPACNTAEYLAYCDIRAAIAKAEGRS